jgi:hypothetical protein
MLVAMLTGFSVFAAGKRGSTTHRAAIEAFKRTLAGTLLPVTAQSGPARS